MPNARAFITAPDSAEHREKVIVHIEVMSITMYEYNFATELSLDGAVVLSTSDYIPAGESETYDMSFYMPDHNATLEVVVHYWDWMIEHRWVYATSKTKVITLEIPIPETYHLSVYIPPWAAGGYVDPGSGDYPEYSTVTLTAHPLPGYQFTSWGGDASGTNPTYNLYMDRDKYVEAYFEKVPVPEFAGTIIRKELKYNGRGNIPIY